VLEDAKAYWTKYEDYHKALEDGYQPLEPEVKQESYHFLQRSGKPSFWSPIYEKTAPDDPNSGYRLVAVMRVAVVRNARYATATMDLLNKEIPVSLVQWHSHSNTCQPPATRKGPWMTNDKEFGYHGSISTEEACTAAGGTFTPYGAWMLHIHPFDPEPWLSALGDMDTDGLKAMPNGKMDPNMKMDPSMKMDPNMKMDPHMKMDPKMKM